MTAPVDAPVTARKPARRTSCGVLVTDDGTRLLLGRFTGLALWDIPKGLADPGEAFDAAALRELSEETGLAAPPAALLPLGVHRYRPGKDLALFLWRVAAMPDPGGAGLPFHVPRPRRPLAARARRLRRAGLGHGAGARRAQHGARAGRGAGGAGVAFWCGGRRVTWVHRRRAQIRTA
jgi:8-oxo-dGTP pyrophosphatase MutT (NUDIX family)